MNICDLPMGSAPEPVRFEHFPTRWQAFLWRNWEYAPAERLAEVLQCGTRELAEAASALGLPPQREPNPEWLRSGYLTVIRMNWHILNYRQLLQLLNWTPEQLAYTLKEEDFFWAKLGSLKPDCGELRFEPLTPEQERATALFRERVRRHIPAESDMEYLEQPFAFAEKYQARPFSGGAEKFELNFIHSYAASCGDIFIDIENHDPIPENLLAQYASMGIQGIWMHAILYLLHPVKGSEEFSAGYETRLRNLATLTERCEKYGVGIYLYLNEPRGMPYAFYEKNPDWAGIDVPKNNMRTNCTSRGKPLEWLEEACAALFRAVPKLAGAFMITMSENPTHCNYAFAGNTCPRCRDRDPADLIAEVVAAAERGIHSSAPEAKLLVSDWAWRTLRDGKSNAEFKKKVIDRLPRNVWIMSVSEWGKTTCAGGIRGSVVDYSISQVGPSAEAVAVWRHAKSRGLKTVAKIQMNNSWELSALPYLPVPYLLQEHLDNLSREGVDGLMLSWTLGGYPGGNLELLYKNVEELATDKFSVNVAGKICEVWHLFSDAFREFPFNCQTIYTAPMNYGSLNLLYPRATGYQATMIGFPYDDLATWRSIYPEDVFEDQFRKVTEGWKNGLDLLDAVRDMLQPSDRTPYEELRIIAEAAYCHLQSTYLQIRFVRQRNAGDKTAMAATVREELAMVHKLHELARRDSRIGFEASNHYYYSLNALVEKMVNCEDILDRLATRAGMP